MMRPGLDATRESRCTRENAMLAAPALVMHTQRARGAIALVATVLSLLAGRADAEVAATGTFDVGVAPALNGMIFFATGIRSVLGQDVDLAADVGDMSYAGTVQVDAAGRGVTFALHAGPSTEFEFDAAGAGVCAVPGCLGGTATFGGILGAIDDPMNVLPDATYAFDGTTYVSPGAPGPVGGFGLNAFAPQFTATGIDVVTSSGPTTFFDSVQGIERTFEATVRYPSVSAAGTTTFVAFSALPGEIPAGYELAPESSVFVDVVTSGVVFGGDLEVCLSAGDADGDGIVDGAGFAVAELRVLHAAATGQAFADVTGGSSPPGIVCGRASSLSPFVLARLSPGGPTTTTTLPAAGCGEPIACIDAALATPLCGAESVAPKLQAVIETKLGSAKRAITKAETSRAKKLAKLLGKARKQLTRIGLRADAFVDKKKGPITAACRDQIRAVLDGISAALDANPPAGRPSSRYPIFIP
jgi:hypothetical protein